MLIKAAAKMKNKKQSVGTTWQQAHSYLGQFKNVIQL
jgi:hypothetical protein